MCPLCRGISFRNLEKTVLSSNEKTILIASIARTLCDQFWTPVSSAILDFEKSHYQFSGSGMTAFRMLTKATIEGAETVQNFSDDAELLLTARLLPGFL